MLRVEHLNKSFNGKKILDNVSFEIKKGHIGLFLGQSGVGKSTLLRIFNNLETYDSGSIDLDGMKLDLATVNTTHTVGMVFQQFNLFEHLTVKENITLTLIQVMNKSEREANKIALEYLQHYELADKADLYPSQLSGGQKQRLALARTLVTSPQVVCLDEPTSALDPLLTNYVAKNIQDLAHSGLTVLVATHDISLLQKLSCTIFLMHNGKIIERASSSEFRTSPSTFPHIDRFIQGI
jgi:polar amino acid transport system ATP-binding protein